MRSVRPTLRVDLEALAHNYREMRRLALTAEVGASVKADAYGLGAEAVVARLVEEGCRTFYVATPEEGVEVRSVAPDADVYVLNGVMAGERDVLAAHGLRPVLSSPQAVEVWRETGLPCAVMFDTGMNRLGLPVGEAEAVSGSGLEIAHVMSHLACSPDPKSEMNARQRIAFDEVWPHFPGVTRSLANSGGVYLGEPYHYDAVRPGIALYGGAATVTPETESTQPVVTVDATVLQVRNVDVGETVGYDATYRAKRPIRIAVVGLGYADGYPVALSNAGVAVWKGRELPVVGRVSMDLTCLDASGTNIAVGNGVAFLGDGLLATARAAGTIDYEILVRLGSRLRRLYG